MTAPPLTPRPLSILIIGPGALGGLLASLLIAGGARVTLLGRRPGPVTFELELDRGAPALDHSHHSEARGQVERFRLPYVTELAAAEEPDRVLVCVKSRDTARAAAALASLPASTPVLLFQNGLTGPRDFRAARAGGRLFGAVTTHGALSLGPGRLRHTGVGATLIAPAEPGPQAQEQAAEIAAELTAHGLEAEARPELEALLWSKAAVNAAINAPSALCLAPNGALLASPAAASLAQAAADETRRVAAALGYRIEAEAWRGVARGTAANACSTLQDVLARRPTEVAAINGAIAELGQAHGIPTPINACLARLIKAREETYAAQEGLVELRLRSAGPARRTTQAQREEEA